LVITKKSVTTHGNVNVKCKTTLSAGYITTCDSVCYVQFTWQFVTNWGSLLTATQTANE